MVWPFVLISEVVIDVPATAQKLPWGLVIPPADASGVRSRSLAFIRTVLLAMTLFHFRDDLADAVDENVLIVNGGQPATLGVILMLLPLLLVMANLGVCLRWREKMGCSMLAISSFGTNTSQTKLASSLRFNANFLLHTNLYLLILLYLMGFDAVLRKR